jgi:DsbC/DsbD-like thiol-disulfide interchange protein
MIRILIFIMAGVIAPLSVFAEPTLFSSPTAPSGPRIKLNVMTDEDLVHPGGRFELYLSVEIEEGWHIYSLKPLEGNELLATRIILDDNVFESIDSWQESSTHLIQDDAQAKLVKGHTHTAVFHNSFYVPQNFKPGNYFLNGKLLYKACDNNLCTLPQSLPFTNRIQVVAAE